MIRINLFGRARCSKCLRTKPAAEMVADSRFKSGFQSYCRECQREYSRAHYAANKERRKEISKAWRAANPDRVAEKVKEWQAEHPELVEQSQKRCRANNPDKYRQIALRWKRRNPEKVREFKRRDYDRHYDRIIVANSRRKARLKALDVGNVTIEGWINRKAVFGNRCAYCGEVETAEERLTMDHVKPLALGGLHCLANLRPACESCNKSKGAKTLSEWRRHRAA